MPSFKGLVERTRQRFNLGDKSFKPTPNVRNPHMLLEAEEFSRHMSAFRTLLSTYEKHMSSFLTTLPLVCRVNLPRVWESVEDTNMSEPIAHEDTSNYAFRMGADYDEVLMVDAAEIMRRRIEGILRPIDRWLESLSIVKHRMARVEALRVQVDARRRRVHKRWLQTLKHMTQGQVAALKAQTADVVSRRGSPVPSVRDGVTGGGSGRRFPAAAQDLETELENGGVHAAAAGTRPGTGDAQRQRRSTNVRELSTLDEGEEDLHRLGEKEDYAREAISQQRRLEAVAESYHEQEQLVFEQLSGLVRDAAYFKSYMAAAFLVLKDTVQATLAALGPCKRPLPGFSERENVESTAAYGRIAPIDDLITSLPPVVADGGRLLPRGARGPSSLVQEDVHPSRLTAQPLQVAADDISSPTARYEPVPPVPKSPERIGTQVTEPQTPLYAGEGGVASMGYHDQPETPGYGVPSKNGLAAHGYDAGGVGQQYGYGTPSGFGTPTVSKGEAGTGSGYSALQQAVAAS